MPAITLGLAEVEERLLALRRRLNTFTVLQAVCVALSTLVLVAAALILLGLSASASLFRVAAWIGAGVSIGALAGAAVFSRRRWLDINATAHLADQRGQLTDRLTTLVDVRARPRPSRLAPLLVAQVLALGGKWQPQHLVPRRVPRSAFALAAALLALATAPLIAPPASPPGAQSAGATMSLAAGGPLKTSQGQAGSPNTNSREDTGTSLAVNSVAGNGSEQWDENGLPEQPQPTRAVAQLPDQLRHAILSAFHREAQDASPDAGKRGSASDTGDPRRQRDHGKQGDTKRDGADKGSEQGGESRGKKSNGAGQAGQQVDQQGHAGTEPNHTGSAPAAGEGTSPSGLMGAKGAGSDTDPNAPKSFKLTITSFLRGVQQKDVAQRQPLARPGAPTGPAEAGTAQLALSERQLTDDALHKAAIPPEYEDLVRRVYSARGEP